MLSAATETDPNDNSGPMRCSKQRMRLLKPAKPIPNLKPVYGTAYQMSDSDTDVVSHQIADFFQEKMTPDKRKHCLKFENKLTAADLFDNYAKSLTGGD